ncbi:MAG: hypothetical protein IKT52_03395 [Oscillospiraceae bacterium]|nr:hypothetical protein [Oscillospiraceae bacterium]
MTVIKFGKQNIELQTESTSHRIESRMILSELESDEIPYVNAHINNISFSTSMEGLKVFVYRHGMYKVEEILINSEANWTVPRSAKIGEPELYAHMLTKQIGETL